MDQTQDVLPKEEALKRSKLISDVKYNIQIFLQKSSQTYKGKCKIFFSYKKSSDPLRLDFIGDIKDFKINGHASNFEKNDFFVLIPEKTLSPENTIEIEYENQYNHTGDGLHQFLDPEDGCEYIYSNLEPYDAHRIFPCFDQPDLKAEFNLTVQAPKDWTVISNNFEESTSENGNLKSIKFKKTKPISTYLFFLGAGDYFQFKSKHKNLDLNIFCRKSLKKYIKHEEMFLITKQGLDFYSGFFGYPYPFEKYDQIFVPEFNSGAMENPGAVTFSENLVTRYEPTYTERVTLADVVLHEMVHMWFGDLVTMKWWDDIWLNESFADFFSYFALVKSTQFKDAWQNFYSRKSWAYYQDQLVTTHAIATEASDTDIAFSNFDGISYAKGASVLKQLMKFLGENAFKKALHTYFKKYEWKNTELKDFLDCMSEASGKDLTEWTKIWIGTTGVNSIEPIYQIQDGKIKSFSLKQHTSAGNNLLRPHKTEVALFLEKNNLCEKEKSEEILYEKELTHINEFVGLKKPDLILLNYNDHDYVKDFLSEDSVNYSLQNLEKITDSLSKQMVLGSLWHMVRDAKLDPEKYLELILDKSPKEENLLTLEIMFARVGQILGYYVDDKKYNLYCEKFYKVGWENIKTADKDNKDAWFSLIISTSSGTKNIGKLTDLLEGQLKIENFEFNPEQRWETITRLSVFGHKKTDQFIKKELERDKSDKGKKSAFEAEVAKLENKENYWNLFVEGKGCSLDYLRSGMGSFFWRKQKQDLRKFSDQFFDTIKDVFEKQERTYAKAFFRGLFPSLYIEKPIIERCQKFLENKKIPQLLKKNMLESLDETKRILKIREKFDS